MRALTTSIAALAAMLGLPAAASAATCHVTPQAVSFGNYDPIGGPSVDGIGSVNVACDVSADFAVALTAGRGSFSNRRMSSGAAQLSYNLYTDASRSIVWADGMVGSSVSGSEVIAAGIGALGRPPAAPRSQARIRGRLHSQLRDRRSISHHYDLSNEFYSLILEPQMAYSSGYHSSPEQPLADAQHDKLSLVCRKLGLEPGMSLLDVGCGWGSMSLHAAEHFGARVVGVTIAAEQKKFIDARIRERGLEDRVEIRLQDYREVPERGTFDAVSSIEMGEHVGQPNYPTYASVLHRSVRPGGRVLVQQMSRTGRWPGGGPFIESFIAPDMFMRPVGETVALLEAGGLEVRDVHALREHYVLTVAGWLERFEANVERLTQLVGEEVVRVWRLYLVGGSMAFRDGRMGVDQILMVRPGGPHTVPLRRDW